ncbi:MAG: hypothetical protein RL664_990 [Bacteroidota bacterium]
MISSLVQLCFVVLIVSNFNDVSKVVNYFVTNNDLKSRIIEKVYRKLFIFLNLILSCIAALQAPVIMMSQNRQEEKDRSRAKKDYMINLKAELEIRMLHEKIDHLILHQQQDLLEIQNIQVDMLTDVLNKFEKSIKKE